MKLVHFVDKPTQLFDLVKDPEEANNLANDPEYADVLERKMTLLRARIDPGAVNAAAKSAESALIAAHGGKAAVLRALLSPGDEVIVDKTLYGCTFAFMRHGLA